MPYRSDVFARNHYYHIYNRGVGRGLIFFNSANYEHCLNLIDRYHRKYKAAVIALCLMPNPFPAPTRHGPKPIKIHKRLVQRFRAGGKPAARAGGSTF